jgi:hypothetical protein
LIEIWTPLDPLLRLSGVHSRLHTIAKKRDKMSAIPDPSIYFKSLRNAIIKNKDQSVIEKTPEVLTLSFADLIYSLTPSREESIAFRTLNLDFTIDSRGEITLMELENGEIKFYDVGDSPMKSRLFDYLAWRANVVTTAGI